ncbi:capsid cement protein [Mycolicibacterium sp. HS_4_1]
MSTTLPNPRVYAPGADVTAEATADITARRFVAISGNRTAGGNLSVAHATAAGRVFGVSGSDAATGDLVTVARDGVLKVIAGGNIAAFAEVEVGTAGRAITKASGVAVGYAVTGAANNGIAEISLY